MRKISELAFIGILTAVLLNLAVTAQTTAFTYQGKLTDNNVAANGQYDMQFRLTDVGGTTIVQPQTILNVQVTSGIFTVALDFGAGFDGTERYIEVGVRPGGSNGPFTTLQPRIRVNSAPYSIRSLSAADAQALGGTTADQFVLTGDSRLSDARMPLPGSNDYIRNTQQGQSASFNISGPITSGTVIGNTVVATSQFNLGNTRILTMDNFSNLFAGRSAGISNAGGVANSFFGQFAGSGNISGSNNSFFGTSAGSDNATGTNNSFFGNEAGKINLGGSNSFFGASAGSSNIFGINNAFFGAGAGLLNQNGSSNAYFGAGSGGLNSSGEANSFFGTDAGGFSTGSFNVFMGWSSGKNVTGIENTIIGYNASPSATTIIGNTLVGNESGLVLTNGSFNTFLGRRTGIAVTSGSNNTFLGYNTGISLVTGTGNTAIGSSADIALPGINFATAIGAGASVSTSNTIVLGTVAENTRIPGTLEVSGVATLATLGPGGATQLCRNGSNQISVCSSSLRYKSDVTEFTDGLSILRRLRPIAFLWKAGGMRDVGFGAEDVAKVDERFVVFNERGEVEGVKYDRLTTVLVNVVRDQQDQIEQQRKEINALRELVCADHPDAGICREEKR